MSNEQIIIPEKMQAGIDKRKKQLKDLEHWIETRKGYKLQLNFCIQGSSDHTCITISGCRAPEIASVAILCLKTQIASLEKKQAIVAQKTKKVQV